MPTARPFRPLRLLTLTALMVAVSVAMTPLAVGAEPGSRLDVQAEAELQVVPDQATVSARLWEDTPVIAQREASDPKAMRDARNRLEARAATLILTLERAGVTRQAIRAGSLNVKPQRLPGERNENGERDTLVRTRLERPVRVQLDELEQLPGLLDALTEAGVDALDGVNYDLADREAASDEALIRALEKARHKAILMTETLGIDLGKVIAVSETRPPIIQPRMMAMSAEGREGSPRTEYRPGTIPVSAGVSVSWEIVP